MSVPHHITLWPRSLAWRAQIWRTGLSDAIRRYGRNALIMLSMLCVAATPALAQLRIEITEGVVAPTPIAIANFTGADGVETDEGLARAKCRGDVLFWHGRKRFTRVWL